MGTTVTGNLALIKPDDDESIKANLPTFDGWAAQNAANCNAIDPLFRMSTGTFTLNWTGSGSNPTLGSGGFTEGKYIRLWPRMVFVYFRINMGAAGFATGSGSYRLSFPFSLDPALIAFGPESGGFGKAIYKDASAVNTSANFTVDYVTSVPCFILRPSAGGVWDPTNPVVPAQGDLISGYMMYPTTDA
jgi:hypothetical protein